QGPNIIEYRFKNTPPSFADIPVESLHLSTVDDQFARVTIRYRGEDTHKRILAYLESEFGRMERLPGQMLRGLNQQYNWRGSESEINLTYQAGTERGYLFLDSRTLAPRFNDLLADTAEEAASRPADLHKSCMLHCRRVRALLRKSGVCRADEGGSQGVRRNTLGSHAFRIGDLWES